MILPLETYRQMEQQLGKTVADQYVQAFEIGFEQLQKRVDTGMTERKFQVRDELLKEVTTKSELQQVKIELQASIDRVSTKLNFLIALVILVLTVLNPAVTKLLEYWFKL